MSVRAVEVRLDRWILHRRATKSLVEPWDYVTDGGRFDPQMDAEMFGGLVEAALGREFDRLHGGPCER